MVNPISWLFGRFLLLRICQLYIQEILLGLVNVLYEFKLLLACFSPGIIKDQKSYPVHHTSINCSASYQDSKLPVFQDMPKSLDQMSPMTWLISLFFGWKRNQNFRIWLSNCLNNLKTREGRPTKSQFQTAAFFHVVSTEVNLVGKLKIITVKLSDHMKGMRAINHLAHIFVVLISILVIVLNFRALIQ